jgi:transposase
MQDETRIGLKTILGRRLTAAAVKPIAIPDNIVLLFQPAHCPELNPTERLWLDSVSHPNS